MSYPTTAAGHREILFNAFDMNCVVHQSPGLWRHPEDRARDYNTIGYWTHIAKTLEAGLFDGLFIADVLGPYDVFGENPEAALRAGAQIPLQDPFLLVSAMAAVTEEPRIRNYRRDCLRASLPILSPTRHPGSPHRRSRRLERGHRLPALGGSEHGPG